MMEEEGTLIVGTLNFFVSGIVRPANIYIYVCVIIL